MLPRHPTVGKQSCPRLASDFSGGENGRVPKKDNVAAWLLLRKVNRRVASRDEIGVRHKVGFRARLQSVARCFGQLALRRSHNTHISVASLPAGDIQPLRL
jgi:hypothetical protein